MSKKFDAAAYVAGWDSKVIPIMVGWIILSLALAIFLNVKTRPDCLRHEYVFCGTETVLQGEEEGAAHGAAAGHGSHEPASDAAHPAEQPHTEH